MGAGSYYDGSSSGYDAKADSGSINSGGRGFPQQLNGLLDMSRPHLLVSGKHGGLLDTSRPHPLFSGELGGLPDITRPHHLPGSDGYGGVIPQQSGANTDGGYGMAGVGYGGGGGYNSKASGGSSRAGGGGYHQLGGRESMPNRPSMQDTGLLGFREAEVDEIAIRYAREEALLRSVRARALEDELARRRK